MTNNEASENEKIVFLQANGAKFDKSFRQWTIPGVRGFLSTFRAYSLLKEKNLKNNVDNQEQKR